jgi:hypothetical protein
MFCNGSGAVRIELFRPCYRLLKNGVAHADRSGPGEILIPISRSDGQLFLRGQEQRWLPASGIHRRPPRTCQLWSG